MELSRAVLVGDKTLITETYHDKTISKDLIFVVASITKSKKILELAMNEESEDVHMCVIEDWIEESRKDGWASGWNDGRTSGWNDGRASGWSACESAWIQKLFQNGMELEEIERMSELPRETLLMIINPVDASIENGGN